MIPPSRWLVPGLRLTGWPCLPRDDHSSPVVGDHDRVEVSGSTATVARRREHVPEVRSDGESFRRPTCRDRAIGSDPQQEEFFRIIEAKVTAATVALVVPK